MLEYATCSALPGLYLDLSIDQHREKLLQVLAARHPHLSDKIKLYWGTNLLQDLFSKWLITDTKTSAGVERQGFPTVSQEILLALAAFHGVTFGFEATLSWAGAPDKW